MKTTEEIKTEMIRTLKTIITLKSNVFNGCFSDQPELEKQMARIPAMKEWAIANGKIQDIRNFFAATNFGRHNQFSAAAISTMFN